MLFFELIQVAIGRRQQLSMVPSDSEWRHLYQLAEQHSLVGICYEGLKRLPQEQCPAEETLIDWIWQSQRIVEQSTHIARRSAEICQRLEKDGFDVCLLKGEGNALLYGELGPCRQSGDADIWILPHDRQRQHPKRRVIEYVRRQFVHTRLRFHHIDYPVFDDAEVELHFVPIYLNNPRLNHRLNVWYQEQLPEQLRHRVMIAGQEVSVPTLQFNLLYHLLHIYKHLFEEGIGLRQMMDYYFVLQQANNSDAGILSETRRMLSSLKLETLAGAVMYVLQEVFGLTDSEMLCPVRRREGIALLSEMMQSGNFGQYDTRYVKEAQQGADARSQMHRYWRKTKRNLILALDYPHEGLWEPLFRLYHFFWRALKLWRI